MKNNHFNNYRNKGVLSAEGSLLPGTLFYILMAVTLALPNLVYSGLNWYDTLHLLKWAVCMVPVAVAALLLSLDTGIRGYDESGLRVDAFAWAWLGMLVYVTLQSQWVEITSWSTFFKEWYFFACIIGVYILTFSRFKNRGWHRVILLLSSLSGALTVLFAELQIYELTELCPFVMNTPGHYIGNTGQQNMMAVWASVNVLNSLYLHTFIEEKNKSALMKALAALNVLLLAANSWGLFNSSSRSGILALVSGVLFFFIVLARYPETRGRLRRFGFALAVVLSMLALNVVLGELGIGRGALLAEKAQDSIENTVSIGKRREIWQSSIEVFKVHPIKGVGLGHFKWHYMEGQRLAFEHNPAMEWQFTYWAHNEFIQWFAEFGIAGGLFLAIIGLCWFIMLGRAVVTGRRLSPEAMWGVGILFLIFFDAIFTRPFHRIEISVWIPFAFAFVNRDISDYRELLAEKENKLVINVLAGLIIAASVSGLFFIGSGMYGDKCLRKSTLTRLASEQNKYIERALSIPMTRDEAQERYAYHLIEVSEVTKKPEDISNGINQLYRSFKIRPKAKQLNELYLYGKRYRVEKLIKELDSLLFPEMVKRMEQSVSIKQ